MLNFLRRLFPVNSPVRKLWYLLKAVSATLWYRFPAKKLKMIGITGTDGKTTTVEMISQILQEGNIPHLKISTDSLFLNGQKWPNKTKRTTLSPWAMQKLLRRAVQEKAEMAVLEVSSHATEQKRIWSMRFDFAGITNITRDEHNEDHGGFENYAKAKKKLFTKYLKPDGVAVLNADNEFIAAWKNDLPQQQIWISAQENEADIQAENFETTKEGIAFTLAREKVRLPLVGQFNMENAAVAFAITQSLGILVPAIIRGLEKFSGVAGRMEPVEAGQPFGVYIDDAQSPHAVEQGIRSLRRKTPGKVWVVFGCCGGGRDRAKRPKVGRITGELSDFVVLTDDEPYTESPELIRKDVKKGLQETKVWNEGDDSPHYWEIPDRRNAIEFALQSAAANDAILIFGMGSYTTRNIGGREVPWSDKAVVKEILNLAYPVQEAEQEKVREDLEGLKEKVEKY